MRVKRYLEFVNEGLREEEFNRILDKISKSGRKSLNKEEERKLSEFDGKFDERPLDKVEIDHEGDLRVNGKRYNPYNIPSEFYDEEESITDYKPSDLDDDLIEYINMYLDENFIKKVTNKSQYKQVFDMNGNILTPEEVIRKTLWDMEISDVKGSREYIKSWIERK